MPRKLLICWIGHHDLRAMAFEQPTAKKKEILDHVGEKHVEGDVGPIRTLTDQIDFDEIVLLNDYKADWSKRYAQWLGGQVEVRQVKPKTPTDYESIFRVADAELDRLRQRKDWKDTELCIHLSPGSPAMTAVSLLLGKTKYPATFYQTYKGKAWETEVPFDIAVDFLPELYRDPDAHFRHLVAQSPKDVHGFEHIVGDSKEIREAVGRAKRVAVRSFSVLLLGESGTGKELFARAIVNASPRHEKPFIAINCAALSKELLESELFGHKKGAFTGATEDRVGAFRQADGGTLFLDEVGECSQELQAKLLRVLEPPADGSPCTRVFSRVGDTDEIRSDVRVIAATNCDLVSAIADGGFREDLYYRLADITITLPPLRRRKSDIPGLTKALMDRVNRQVGEEEPDYSHKSISDSAISFVRRHNWPGNIRQLYKALLQAAVMTDGDTIKPADIEAAIGQMPLDNARTSDAMEKTLGHGFNIEDHLNDIRKHYLRRAMEEANGTKAEASRLLGIANYQTLDAQLKRLEIEGDWS